jgi:hypothetical protein
MPRWAPIPDLNLAAVVRDELACSRGAGDAFDDVWPLALEVALERAAALPAYERHDWLAALRGTRDAWAAAYDRTPQAIADAALEHLRAAA